MIETKNRVKNRQKGDIMKYIKTGFVGLSIVIIGLGVTGCGSATESTSNTSQSTLTVPGMELGNQRVYKVVSLGRVVHISEFVTENVVAVDEDVATYNLKSVITVETETDDYTMSNYYQIKSDGVHTLGFRDSSEWGSYAFILAKKTENTSSKNFEVTSALYIPLPISNTSMQDSVFPYRHEYEDGVWKDMNEGYILKYQWDEAEVTVTTNIGEFSCKKLTEYYEDESKSYVYYYNEDVGIIKKEDHSGDRFISYKILHSKNY